MSDKDQFTFEDDDDFPETSLGDENKSQKLDLDYDDDFPETDLSAAFSEGEHTAEDPALGEPEEKDKGGNSKTRILLMVLLLVIAVGAGAYYFMGLGGTTPSVPTVPVPAQKTTKSVALPVQPAESPVAPATVEPAAKPVAVAVPPPPTESAVVADMDKQPVAVAPPQAPPVVKPAEKVVAEKPTMELAQPTVATSPAPIAAPEPALQKAVVPVPPAPTATELPKQVIGGVFTLDAGSYLLESNRDSLVAKIRKLGYEPLVTPIDATLDMTRLRLGTFNKDEVHEALKFARSIEPGAYSAPAGDGYVVYAGTFLKSRNIDKLNQLFSEEGVKVYPEPVQVVRTLSRIRFGSFATKEAAAAAAEEVAKAGIKAVVVKSK